MDIRINMVIPELLAPAGSVETLYAAITAGADSCYLGYGKFSARARAKNFTADELRLAADYAHAHGKKIYVTVNTLIYDREIPELLDVFGLLSEISSDAVIIQDIGILSILRDYYPELPVHASTQMFCHNSLSAEFLKQNGVSRIILPREMTLEEISSITRKVPMDYEVFVHGAMCFSFSGCCLASSYLYGESGNRGECRQVCRYLFQRDGIQSYPFAMKDLNASKILEKIIAAGVKSLKIEGRLKNTEYVSRTVSAYRKMLDSLKYNTRLKVIDPGSERESSEGYFTGIGNYQNLILKDSGGTSGEKIGLALSFDYGEVLMELKEIPQKGTRLRIQAPDGRNICEGTLLDYRVSSREKGKSVLKWKTKVNTTKNLNGPFTVYNIGKSFPYDYAGLLKTHAVKQSYAKVNLIVKLAENTLNINAEIKETSLFIEKIFNIETQPSKTSPFTSERLSEIFSQTGDYTFDIDTIQCITKENLFCQVKAIKEIKRRFYSELEEKIIAMHFEKRKMRIDKILNKLNDIKRKLRDPENNKLKAFYNENEKVLSKSDEISYIILREKEVISGNTDIPKKQIIVDLPLFLPEGKIDKWKNHILKLIENGYRIFTASNTGWLQMLKDFKNITIVIGPFLYTQNSFAVDFIMKSGAEYFILSPDIKENEIGDLISFSNKIEIVKPPKIMFATRLRPSPGEFSYKNIAFKIKHMEDYTIIEQKDN